MALRVYSAGSGLGVGRAVFELQPRDCVPDDFTAWLIIVVAAPLNTALSGRLRFRLRPRVCCTGALIH